MTRAFGLAGRWTISGHASPRTTSSASNSGREEFSGNRIRRKWCRNGEKRRRPTSTRVIPADPGDAEGRLFHWNRTRVPRRVALVLKLQLRRLEPKLRSEVWFVRNLSRPGDTHALQTSRHDAAGCIAARRAGYRLRTKRHSSEGPIRLERKQL